MKFISATVILLTFAISACSRYQFLFNDNVVYTPSGVPPAPGLLNDANFQGCLNQYFANADSQDPAAVKLLACPSAGIQSLAGISGLPNLEQLELSDNQINDLSPLLSLRNLRLLSIRNNRITNINALMSLPILRFVSLQGNNEINCSQLNDLEKKIGNSLNKPQSCRK